MATRTRKALKSPGDPLFAAEMAGLEQERRQREEERTAEFQRDWAKRLEKPLPPLLPSTLHVHDEDCWTETQYMVYMARNIWYQRCRRIGTIKEVPRP